ncbi:MAG: ACP S-malonyltransferase [Patescibacteria group bacterium]|nr:ACP S-malonyltransferase [Patescibacteria group bacterium]
MRERKPIPETILRYSEREGLRKTALIFPGQGVQEVGMGKEFCAVDALSGEAISEKYPEVAKLYNEAKEILGYFPFDLTENDLKETRFAQPAIFIYSEACRLVFIKERKAAGLTEIRPRYYAGNSLGEFNALLAAGAFEFKNGLKLVKLRGEKMQEACEERPSGLAAFLRPSGDGVDPEEKELFERLKTELTMAERGLYLEAENSESQFVFGGLRENLEEARRWLTSEGYLQTGFRMVPLNVAGAFHCELMASALPDFTDLLKELKRKGRIKKTKASVIANTTGKPISTPEEIEKELIDHMVKPVLWKDTVGFLEEGVASTVEFGKKATLSNMMKNKGIIAGVAAVGVAAGIATVLYFRNRESKIE